MNPELFVFVENLLGARTAKPPGRIKMIYMTNNPTEVPRGGALVPAVVILEDTGLLSCHFANGLKMEPQQ
jgi:hypothetical protein